MKRPLSSTFKFRFARGIIKQTKAIQQSTCLHLFHTMPPKFQIVSHIGQICTKIDFSDNSDDIRPINSAAIAANDTIPTYSQNTTANIITNSTIQLKSWTNLKCDYNITNCFRRLKRGKAKVWLYSLRLTDAIWPNVIVKILIFLDYTYSMTNIASNDHYHRHSFYFIFSGLVFSKKALWTIH